MRPGRQRPGGAVVRRHHPVDDRRQRGQLVLVEEARPVAADRDGHRRETGYGEQRDRARGAGQDAAPGRLSGAVRPVREAGPGQVDSGYVRGHTEINAQNWNWLHLRAGAAAGRHTAAADVPSA